MKHIHFIGIGGIGISAIARMMLHEGNKVTGNDLDEFEIVAALRKLGVDTKIGKDNSVIPKDANMIVYSVAWETIAPELLEYAKNLQVPMFTYPEMLGIISKDKFTIAIAGTHGKTTTTAMIASIMIEAGLTPTVIVGSLVRNQDGKLTNFIPGESNYLVVEADEYKRSFMNLSPHILVINNIDEDHLDYYKNLAGVQTAFIELVGKLPKDGFLVTNINDPHIEPVLEDLDCTIIDYPTIDIETDKKRTERLSLRVPGTHNMLNAKAALGVAAVLSIDVNVATKALNNFKSPWRRFEFVGETKKGALVYDDYAHNPQKVKAAILGAQEMHPGKRIVVVFQPHLFSRTKSLLDDFVQALATADEIVLAPIYAARELHDRTISSNMIAEKINHKMGTMDRKAKSFENFQEIKRYLEENLHGSDVLIVMGAGDIYQVAKTMVQ